MAVPVTFGIGDTATLTVSYDPVDRVADTCTVTPTFGSPSGTGGSFVLTGDGLAPVLVVTPTSLSFPDQRWNGGSSTLTVTLENAGEEPFTAALLPRSARRRARLSPSEPCRWARSRRPRTCRSATA